MIDNAMKDKLIEAATDMLKQAYVPYSEFPVGAALLTSDGQIYSGCNIENSSYGLSNCAERTAVFKAVADGHHQFSYLVVTGTTNQPIAPCGACRQVISEFAPADLPVLLTNQKGQMHKTTISDLLPGAFKSADMDI
ncbi:cytidine deaminase [Aerococcus kribbianus]|uniref:Cytidine deaminase n=1 Tax=Aerococcus kribbianus TaxID=2999064 RepID=A0A9X3JF88_9LACT|nr:MULTISPECIES: cytidine deaminase [unclassified Aerococcus]MCZ0717363.1 cytidine deaminase [Aerococcus sp. YH-aer221]MCZ0725651.1 cytidine deaminase [Aerococcus sp. YH-aer222]